MVIPGYSSYDVDEHGVVTNLKTGQEVKCRLYKGYRSVTLTHDDGRRCSENVHVLMANAFGLPDGYKYVVAFKDGDRNNLVPSNLERVSRNELSRRHYNPNQRKKENFCNTEENRQMLLDTMYAVGEPVTMVYLASELSIPYSYVRYSMQRLIELGKVEKTQGGYRLI